VIARSVVLAALTLMAPAVAPAATQSQDNPVCDSDFSGLWKREVQFLEIWWNEARPVDVAECLDAGADPNAKIALRTTPLHVAIGRCRQILARPLLEYGADPNAERGLRETPLEAAESCANASERDNIVGMLREAGAGEP